MRQCKVLGCHHPASSRFSIYCVQHKAQHRRHGAVNQTGVTKHELKPYRALVQARIEKNKNSDLWERLLGRWKAVVETAQTIVDEWQGGRPTIKWRRLAAFEVLKLDNAVNVSEVIETVLALYIMQDQEPRRFADERAFRTQMVRRVRGLTSLNASHSIDLTTGRKKRVYQELSPRVAACMGSWLTEAFGAVGVHLAKIERRDHERRQQELLGLRQSLEELA